MVYFENTSEVPLFVTLEWEGIPKRDDLAPVQQGWPLGPGTSTPRASPLTFPAAAGRQLLHGFRVAQEDWEYIDEVALVQIPAGWEIENPGSHRRPPGLGHGVLPRTGRYVDIRDDRIMWFFDKAPYYSYDFMVKIMQ